MDTYTKLLTLYYSRHQASITAHRLVNRLVKRMVKYYPLQYVKDAINQARTINGRDPIN